MAADVCCERLGELLEDWGDTDGCRVDAMRSEALLRQIGVGAHRDRSPAFILTDVNNRIDKGAPAPVRAVDIRGAGW